jgi:hypothetical protein
MTEQKPRNPEPLDASSDPFGRLAHAFGGTPGVTRAKVFGYAALKIHGKVFATVADGRLVVKLPPERITELIAQGHGQTFIGYGKVMRGWIQLITTDDDDWRCFAEEARAYIAE